MKPSLDLKFNPGLPFLCALAFQAMAVHPYASCGLEFCPIIRSSSPEKVAVDLAWRFVSFEDQGSEVSMQQIATRLEWRPSPYLALGTEASISIPVTESKTAFGIANPLVFAEARTTLEKPTVFAFGSQLELPFGDVAEGYASDHAMWVPYATVGHSLGNVSLSLRLGWTIALPFSRKDTSTASPYDNPPIATLPAAARVSHVTHTSPEDVSYIEPHSDNDLLFRVGAGWKRGKIRTEIQFSGARALVDGFSPRSFFSTGASIEIPLGGHLSIRPEFRIPLTYPARFERGAGVGVRTAF